MRSIQSTFQLASLCGLVLAFGAACPNREVTAIEPNQQKEEKKLIPVSEMRDVDILFVIDNSGSMAQEQTSLKSNFKEFMKVLNTIDGGKPNMHIGVVTTNAGAGNAPGCENGGDNGVLQNKPDPDSGETCSGPNGRYIIDVAEGNGRQTNYTGSLEDTFSCIAARGTKGCGLEAPLESMKRALDGSRSENAGFLRPNAYLAVVILSDEDDCSAINPAIFEQSDAATAQFGPNGFRCERFGITCAEGDVTMTPGTYTNCVPRLNSYLRNPEDYANFLKSLKADPNLVIVSAITGDKSPIRTEIFQVNPDVPAEIGMRPSCKSVGLGEADPAVRTLSFVEQFKNSTFTSICEGDLRPGLKKIAEQLARVIGTPCLEGDLDATDVHPDKIGIQLDCAVMDVRFPNTAKEESRTIRRCEQNSDTTITPNQTLPCWWVKHDDTCADPARYPTGLELLIERSETVTEVGWYVSASCAVK